MATPFGTITPLHTIKADLRVTLGKLQEQHASHIAPLEAARAARDKFMRDNAKIFDKERELAQKVLTLQADPILTELEKAISDTARALGDKRMSDGA